MRLSLSKTALTFVVMMSASASAGPIEYGTCQTECNNLAAVCYYKEGYTFGKVQASDATPEVRACDGDLGTCSAKCATTHLPPCEINVIPGATAQCVKWLP